MQNLNTKAIKALSHDKVSGPASRTHNKADRFCEHVAYRKLDVPMPSLQPYTSNITSYSTNGGVLMNHLEKKKNIFRRKIQMVKSSGLPDELQETLIDMIRVQRGG